MDMLVSLMLKTFLPSILSNTLRDAHRIVIAIARLSSGCPYLWRTNQLPSMTIQAQNHRPLKSTKRSTVFQRFITHDLGVVAKCWMVAVMYAGEIIEYALLRKFMSLVIHTRGSLPLATAGWMIWVELFSIPGHPPSLLYNQLLGMPCLAFRLCYADWLRGKAPQFRFRYSLAKTWLYEDAPKLKNLRLSTHEN